MIEAQLSPEDERFLEALVEKGRYATCSAALHDAVDLLRSRDELREGLLEGIASQRVPAANVYAHLRRRAQEITRHAVERSARENGGDDCIR